MRINRVKLLHRFNVWSRLAIFLCLGLAVALWGADSAMHPGPAGLGCLWGFVALCGVALIGWFAGGFKK